MRKGITPIISIIVLLLITIALAGVAWVYLSGMLGSHIESSFTIPAVGTFCTLNATSDNLLEIVVTNTGTTTLTTSHFIVIKVDGNNATASASSLTLAPKEAGAILSGYDCGTGGCSTGEHTIELATASGAMTRTLTCK